MRLTDCIVNLHGQDDETPLHCAAARNNIDCLQMLVTRGADVNVTDKVSLDISSFLLSQCVKTNSLDLVPCAALSFILNNCMIFDIPVLGSKLPACGYYILCPLLIDSYTNNYSFK